MQYPNTLNGYNLANSNYQFTTVTEVNTNNH